MGVFGQHWMQISSFWLANPNFNHLNSKLKQIPISSATYTPELIINIGQMSLSSTAQCIKEIFTFLTGLSQWNKEVAELQNSQLLLHLLRMESWQMKAQEETRKSF